jgi:hypothetical protein
MRSSALVFFYFKIILEFLLFVRRLSKGLLFSSRMEIGGTFITFQLCSTQLFRRKLDLLAYYLLKITIKLLPYLVCKTIFAIALRRVFNGK